MSGIEYDAEALNEAFYNDPASVIAAASAEAAAQAAANVAQSLHQQNLQAELAKTAGEVEQLMQERLGDKWDAWREQASALAGQHNMVTYGETPALIAETLTGIVGSLEQQEAKQRAAEIEAENEKWREQIRSADVSRFQL